MDHSQPTAANPPQEEPPERFLRRSGIELRRLLHCMQNNEAPPLASWESVLMRADMAQALWQQVQDAWRLCHERHIVIDPQDEESFLKLREEVEVTCRRAHQVALDIQRKNKEEGRVDLIAKIFLQSEEEQRDDESVNTEQTPESPLEDILQESAAPHQEVALRGHSQSHDSVAKATHNRNIEELQKAQREQLEKEISLMAEQLKYSTANMHSTLKNQTEDLNEMGDLALENVDKMTNVTKDVTQHVRKQWRNTIATWTMLLTLFGTFFFCFLTIRVVPKRKNACILFCPKKPKPFTEKGQYCVQQDDGSIICEERAAQAQTPVDGKQTRPKEVQEPCEETCEPGEQGECVAKYEDNEQGVSEEEDISEHHFAMDDIPVEQDEDNFEEDVEEGNASEAVEQDKAGHDEDEYSVGMCVAGEQNGDCRVNDVKNDEQDEEEIGVPASQVLDFFDLKDVRRAVAQNNVNQMRGYLIAKPEYAHIPDINGWQPIHEASRLGHVDMVKFLIEEGRVDVNARTGRFGPTGGTPLWWAHKSGLQDTHDVIVMLKAHGADSFGPNEVRTREQEL